MEVTASAFLAKPITKRAKMRIAVTGRNGQVAKSLIERAAGSDYQIVTVGRPELDLTGDATAIHHALDAVSPDVIVASAAYTAVDRAEDERDLAFAVNETGAGAVAKAAARIGVPLIHLSTDYVFAGAKPLPYLESDPTGPTSVYGASKLAGERAVILAHDNVAILRTAWVYSPFGSNFAKTMVRLAADRDEISVVADQVGNPTSALDIADAVMRIASNLASSNDARMRGIFHMTASGEGSWADFAEAILAISEQAGGPGARVHRIPTEQYPTPAKRPANSRLDCTKLQEAHDVLLPDWRQSIGEVVRTILGKSAGTKASIQ